MKQCEYYVVWCGNKTGVFESYSDFIGAIKGVEKPLFMRFKTKQEADKALVSDPTDYLPKSFVNNTLENYPRLQKAPNRAQVKTEQRLDKKSYWPKDAIVVDGSFTGKGFRMEYRGLDLRTGEFIFHKGPIVGGTNNIAEYLAVIEAMKYLLATGRYKPIYTDSTTALAWIRNGYANTNMKFVSKNDSIFELVDDATYWLRKNRCSDIIIDHWDTVFWGENPADFGRK